MGSQQVAEDPGNVHVQAVVRNARPLPVEARIWHAIFDPDGRELPAWSQTIAVPARWRWVPVFDSF